MELGIEIEMVNLEVGDFCFGNWVVERKYINDFLNSFADGRLHHQLDNMVKGLSEGGERAILLIHGTTTEINKRYSSDIDFFSILGHVLIDYPNVNVLFLKNEIEVANLIGSMYYKIHQPDIPCHTWVKKTKNPGLDVMRSTKVFSLRQSKELLNHFTLQQIFNLPDKELKEIKYIGPATAKKFILLRKKRGLNV